MTSPLRAPFTRFEGPQGNAELAEEVRGSGARKAVGELVTCPFCLGPWVATALTAGLTFAPGVARPAMGVFSGWRSPTSCSSATRPRSSAPTPRSTRDLTVALSGSSGSGDASDPGCLR